MKKLASFIKIGVKINCYSAKVLISNNKFKLKLFYTNLCKKLKLICFICVMNIKVLYLF